MTCVEDGEASLALVEMQSHNKVGIIERSIECGPNGIVESQENLAAGGARSDERIRE
jgi:hypothetical protein